jgi:predicted TPR repeat methyltransferase
MSMMRAVPLDPTILGSLRFLGERCYASAHQALEDGDFRNAARLFALLAALAPRDVRGWAGLAVTKERTGDWRAAAGVHRAGAALAHEPAWCHFGLGRALKRLGRHAEAARAFDAAESATDDNALSCAIEQEKNAS